MMARAAKCPTSPGVRLSRRPGSSFCRGRTAVEDTNGWTKSLADEQAAPTRSRKSSPQRFIVRHDSGMAQGAVAKSVPNFSLRDIGITAASPAVVDELVSSQRPVGRAFGGPALAEKNCMLSSENEQDGHAALSEDLVSAYTAMRGPRPVNQPDPLLSMLARSRAQMSGTSTSSSSPTSGPCFSEGKQSSPYQTTIITPVDDECSGLSSQPTVMYNILRSPQKTSQVREPLIGIHAPEVRLKFEGDPWKCKPFDSAMARKMPPGLVRAHRSTDTGPKSSELGDAVVSPGTFRVLAEGAQLWRTDRLHREAMAGMPEPVRMRPLDASPKAPQPRPLFGDRWNPAGFVSQFDQDSGEPMSPHYKVPSSPSILWTPRPVTPEMMLRHFPHGDFDRMDPAAGEACREAFLGPVPSFGEGSEHESEPELFTDDEVDEVLATHHGPIFDDIHASSFRDAIETMEEHLALSRLEQERMERQNERQRQRLRALERLPSPRSAAPGDHDGLVPQLSHRRAGACAVGPARRARILRHMANQLRENLWAHHCLQESLRAARREHASLSLHIDRLERRLRPTVAHASSYLNGCDEGYVDDDMLF